MQSSNQKMEGKRGNEMSKELEALEMFEALGYIVRYKTIHELHYVSKNGRFIEFDLVTKTLKTFQVGQDKNFIDFDLTMEEQKCSDKLMKKLGWQ